MVASIPKLAGSGGMLPQESLKLRDMASQVLRPHTQAKRLIFMNITSIVIGHFQGGRGSQSGGGIPWFSLYVNH